MDMNNIKPTVLYVDDEINNLHTFMAAFRRHYKILTATTAREAITLLHANNVDLIITDQRMPEMTGVQFLEAIIPEFPDPARMILTGYSDIEAITKAINTGSVLRYITKPWDATELKQIIDMGVKIHQLEKNSKFLLENLERELIIQKETLERFSKYVPENISKDSLMMEDDHSALEGEYRIITALFSDIRQFTRLADTMNPKVLVNYLNRYFSVMVDCVLKNHGSIYKLVGDGMWVIFGWPISSIYNQRNAVYCALDMLESLKELNESLGQEINHETTIGIGITTGEAIVGQIKTEMFSTSIVVGESVDDASFIEDATRNMPNTILLSESTYKSVCDDVEVEKIMVTMEDNTQRELYKLIGKKG